MVHERERRWFEAASHLLLTAGGIAWVVAAFEYVSHGSETALYIAVGALLIVAGLAVGQ